MSKEDILAEIRTLLAGRSAEEVVCNTQTSGAANDIERATDLARNMVTQYGMSDQFGLMALTTVANEYLDGRAMMNCADTTAALADQEVKTLLQQSYDRARKLLGEHRALLDEIALFLLQKETITGDELMAFVNADKQTLPPAGEAGGEAAGPSAGGTAGEAPEPPAAP